jgi:hypothetical protein
MNKAYYQSKKIVRQVAKAKDDISNGRCSTYSSFLDLLDEVNPPKNKGFIKRLRSFNQSASSRLFSRQAS